ncbi:CrcB family protein [Rhodococcus sp. IEGM 248]|nr:CrcB family protein [Rhodococcus sp. IEGM 248]
MDGRRDPNPTLPVDPDTAPRTPGPLHVRPSAIAAVAAGGLLGAPLRYQLGVWFTQASGGWPVTTFAINVAGAFLLGLLLEALTRLGPDTRWRQRVRLCAGTGVLGSFTTYSTLAVDTDLLLRGHQWWAAGSYAVGTVLAGLVATIAGIAVGVRVRSRHAGGVR